MVRRFGRWSEKGVWQRIFAALSDDPDFEPLIVDSTIIVSILRRPRVPSALVGWGIPI